MQHFGTSTTDTEARPLLHGGAVATGALVGLGLAAAAGLLWTGAAFSSHDHWAYDHLAWWLGASVIGAALIAGVATGGLSKIRGLSAGAVNGAVAGALIVLAGGAIALVAIAVNGSVSEPLAVGNHLVSVDFMRFYPAFWTALGGLVAAAAGGVAGGLLPRRQVNATVVDLTPAIAGRLETLNGSAPATVGSSR